MRWNKTKENVENIFDECDLYISTCSWMNHPSMPRPCCNDSAQGLRGLAYRENRPVCVSGGGHRHSVTGYSGNISLGGWATRFGS